MLDQIERIRAKLQTRRAVMNPPAPESHVSAFESMHGVALPTEYRLFLTHVGNGGVGPPSYGLVSLAESDLGLIAEERTFWTKLPEIRRPFPK